MTRQAAIVTKDSIRDMLTGVPHERAQHIIGRALIALLERQTAAEQATNDTTDHNGIGFCGSDARGGSLTAKSYLKSKALQPWQVEKWTRPARNGYPRICKYHAQLNEIALEKARRNAQQSSVGLVA